MSAKTSTPHFFRATRSVFRAMWKTEPAPFLERAATCGETLFRLTRAPGWLREYRRSAKRELRRRAARGVRGEVTA